jgi:membrane protease YdiL (CAAX protease family)
LVYGVLRARTRSIWPSLAVHSIGNALALLAGSL